MVCWAGDNIYHNCCGFVFFVFSWVFFLFKNKSATNHIVYKYVSSEPMTSPLSFLRWFDHICSIHSWLSLKNSGYIYLLKTNTVLSCDIVLIAILSPGAGAQNTWSIWRLNRESLYLLLFHPLRNIIFSYSVKNIRDNLILGTTQGKQGFYFAGLQVIKDGNKWLAYFLPAIRELISSKYSIFYFIIDYGCVHKEANVFYEQWVDVKRIHFVN